MGWCKSPPFFCAASETAQDIIASLLEETVLPKHDFTDKMLSNTEYLDHLQATAHVVNLTEVFVDDFIAATNDRSKAHLAHFSQAMLMGVHSGFPPASESGQHREDPVPQKKLHQGEGT